MRYVDEGLVPHQIEHLSQQRGGPVGRKGPQRGGLDQEGMEGEEGLAEGPLRSRHEDPSGRPHGRVVRVGYLASAGHFETLLPWARKGL